jgi:cysteinyl-tRNA synthetase
MLTLFNTLSGRQEPFESIEPKHVRMYVCGVTVYDYCHIGHARSALVFDVLRRYLEYSGYQVDFVKNFTDVDDKIIKRANEQGVSCDTITNKYIEAYYEDMGKLGIGKPTEEPKATEHMADIIAMTETLINNGLAYTIDGDVYFQVDKYPAYGRLSKRKMEDLQAGARVDVDERKRHPMDFALWKSSKPGEPSWPSPWGAGRPGWHIECSAMSIKHLGETFDIHGGGMDLIFPHHENEIAQSCGATGKEFARYWVHNGFVQINQEKMSKSLGNFFTIREIFEKSEWSDEVTGEILRYFLLSSHYHGPLDFSDLALKVTKNALNGFYDLFNRLREQGQGLAETEQALSTRVNEARRAFEAAMSSDLNTPVALAAFQTLRNEVNKLVGSGLSTTARRQARGAFRSLGAVLGLFQLEPEKWQFTPSVPFVGMNADSGIPPQTKKRHPAYDGDVSNPPLPLRAEADQIQQKVDERNEARKRKDFKRADEIRAELASLGITIEDKPDGTSRWKR